MGGSLSSSKDVELSVNGSIAYAAQTPLILNATVRENVLFCETYDEKR